MIENTLIMGGPASGRTLHSGDNLKPCSCGYKKSPLLLYEKCGESMNSIFVVCPGCNRHTDKTNIEIAIKRWNNNEVKQ